jgi:hypothetical protein
LSPTMTTLAATGGVKREARVVLFDDDPLNIEVGLITSQSQSLLSIITCLSPCLCIGSITSHSQSLLSIRWPSNRTI